MSDYSDTQSTRNQQYENAYKQWVANLSEAERAQLRRSGLLQPGRETYHLSKQGDVSEMPLADTTCAEPGESTEAPMRCESDEEATLAVLRRLIAEILADDNPALSAQCLSMVTGIGFLGESMTETARKHRVTRAAVSKRCIQWANLLCLNPSGTMRRLTARHAYRNAQKKCHSDHERFNSRRNSQH